MKNPICVVVLFVKLLCLEYFSVLFMSDMGRIRPKEPQVHFDSFFNAQLVTITSDYEYVISFKWIVRLSYSTSWEIN